MEESSWSCNYPAEPQGWIWSDFSLVQVQIQQASISTFERELETCFFLSRYSSGGPFFYQWPYLEMDRTLIILQMEKSRMDFFLHVEGFYYPPWISSASLLSAPALVNRDSYIWTSKYDSTYFPRNLSKIPLMDIGKHRWGKEDFWPF